MNTNPLRLVLFGLLLIVGNLLAPRVAHAADPVICSASISTINFGTVDPSTSTSADVTATLSWSCTSHTNQDYNATACFNIGAGPLGLDGSGYRQIQGPGGNLSFQTYLDAARTQVWGSVTTPGYPTPAEANFRIRRHATVSGSIPVYARLFGNQSAATTGTYSSTFSTPQVRITGELTNWGYGSCSTTGNSDAGNFSPLLITAKVAPACTVTATDLDFGTINGFLTSNIDSQSTIGVTCVSGTSYQVGLDNGTFYNAGTRTMQGPGGQIAYALYRDSGRSLPWGHTLGTDTASGSGNGAQQNYTVYGRVPPQTTPSAGTYQDTVTVDVTY